MYYVVSCLSFNISGLSFLGKLAPDVGGISPNWAPTYMSLLLLLVVGVLLVLVVVRAFGVTSIHFLRF